MQGLQFFITVALFSACIGTSGAYAQTITNHAGNGLQGFGGDGGRADDASLNFPIGVHGDTSGVLYVADSGNHTIRRITPLTDAITTIAGTGGISGYTGDGGSATSATLMNPADVFVTDTGVLYIADTGNHVIRSISTTGTITTIAGTGTSGFSGDGGAATSATLNSPSGVCVSSRGVIFIADSGNNRIRRVHNDTIMTVAGNDTAGFSGDGGRAGNAKLNGPSDVYVDTAYTVFIADTNNHRIRAIKPNRAPGSNIALIAGNLSWISTVAGSASGGFSGDGDIPTNAKLAYPEAVVVDSAGNIYVADRFNHRIRRINASGNITTLVGNGTIANAGDEGPANLAQLSSPFGVFVNTDGQILISDSNNHRIRRVEVDNMRGLSGSAVISPGREIQIFGVSITGDGTTVMKSLTLTVSDLSTATGLTNADFDEFRLYESTDSTLDASDTQVGHLDASDMAIDRPFTIEANLAITPGAGETRHYIVSAQIEADAPEQHAFRVGFDTGGLSMTRGGRGSKVRALDTNKVTIDIIATLLVFTKQPANSISGNPLLIQPVVTALDDSGLVDTDFTDVITITHSSAGSLINSTATASSGVATFANVTYIASADNEQFVLTADDQTGGPEGDLPAVAANTIVSNAANDPPVVNFQPFIINEDDSLAFPVAAFISDVDDSVLTIELTASNLTATVADGQITLAPRPDFFGLDTLNVVVTDPFGAQGSDTARIQVKAVNDPPVLTPLGTLIVDEDDTLQLDLSAQVEDVDNPFANLSWTLTPSAGLAMAFDSETGLLDLWTQPDSSGAFSLRLSVRDPEALTARDTANISIVAVSDPPSLAMPDTISIQATTRDNLSPLALDLKDFTTDIDDSLSSLTFSGKGTRNISIWVDDHGIALIEPKRYFAGVDSVIFTVTEPSGSTTTNTIRIEVIPEPEPDPGDFDGNGSIDLYDFFLFADNFGLSIVHTNWNREFDLDNDGRVGFEDFFLFADHFQAFQASP